MKILKITALFLGAIVMTGCMVSAPVATKEQKRTAIQMKGPSDKATLYAIRNEKGSFHAHKIVLKIGGAELTTLGETFSVFTLEPGKGKLKTDFSVMGIGTDAEITMDLKPGKKYYVHVSKHYRPLIGPRAELVEISETDALPLMGKLRMVAKPITN
jgi:hypothetical protein